MQLTLNYFLLKLEAPTVYAEVTQATGNDADSTPNNGTPPVVNEDDEASTDDSMSPMEMPDLMVTNLMIDNPVRLLTPTDLSYRIENIGNASAGGPFDIHIYYSMDDELNFLSSTSLGSSGSLRRTSCGNYLLSSSSITDYGSSNYNLELTERFGYFENANFITEFSKVVTTDRFLAL